MKIKLPYQVVLLVRGEGSKTPLIVLPHEVPILRAMHGENAVVETDDKPPVATREFDTQDEFARLQQMYRGNNDKPNPTLEIFKNLREFEDAFDEVGDAGVDKAELIAQAKALGISANKNWGIEKLQKAIAEASEDSSEE